MSRFNTKESSDAKTTNLAGGVAYKMGTEEELVHAVLSTFLEDKAYETGDARLTRIKSLVKGVDPIFVAKLAIVARHEFLLRTVSHVLVGELAKIHKGDSLVMNTIVEIAMRPDDLTEILAYVGNPIPKSVRRGFRHGITKFNRYQLAKYKGEGKKVSLVDAFNLCHPDPKHANDEQKKAWADLIKGNLASFNTWEKEISDADNKDKKKAWSDLVRENKLGYMALLRNLNNLIKNDVDKDVIEIAANKLKDPDEVRKSKQLPFRFVTAYDNVTGNTKLLDAVSFAMDTAVENVPEFSGSTLIAVDSSGSMSGDPIKKAAIFAAALFKANSDADVILYDTKVAKLNASARLPVIDVAKFIEKSAMGGGTDTSLVFRTAEKKYDRVFILSDNESWVDSGYRVGTSAAYNEYKTRVGANPYVYAIDIAGYGTKDIKGGKVFHLTGWSSRLFDFVKYAEKGQSLVEYIKTYIVKKERHEKEDNE